MQSQFGVDEWTDVEFLACHSQLRVPGLGTELVRIGMDMLAAQGTKVTKLKHLAEKPSTPSRILKIYNPALLN